MTEHVCEQDTREKELLEQGYVKIEKCFFRIGRAIFVVDTLRKDYSQEEAVETPLGTVATLNRPGLEFDQEDLSMLQSLFGSTGYLRIVCEGDPDCGFAGNSEILLTGYRGGLDDVIVDKELLQTVHGSGEDIMRNFAKTVDWRSKWIHVPRWDTYDGIGYRMKSDEALESEVAILANRLREVADKLEHKDDMPDWVKEKFEKSE